MTDSDDQHQPDVLEAYWDRDQVDALFADLKQGATVKQVQVRASSGDNRPEGSVTTLEQARELLDDGLAKAIQIFYEFGGETWCDTLIPLPDTIRIVRTTVPRR
jgi:hypothetical protein